MAINTNVENLQNKVDLVVTRLKNIETICKQARDNLGTDYSYVLSIPAVLIRFETEVSAMAAAGFTAAVLGPVMDAKYGTDWATMEADYDQLRIDLPPLAIWIMTNANLFTHSMDGTGARVYNIPIGATEEAELSVLTDTVLSRFA